MADDGGRVMCWPFMHRWSEWSKIIVTKDAMNAYQIRKCLECGKAKLRWVE